jgi:hypothetical protein
MVVTLCNVVFTVNDPLARGRCAGRRPSGIGLDRETEFTPFRRQLAALVFGLIRPDNVRPVRLQQELQLISPDSSAMIPGDSGFPPDYLCVPGMICRKKQPF